MDDDTDWETVLSCIMCTNCSGLGYCFVRSVLLSGTVSVTFDGETVLTKKKNCLTLFIVNTYTLLTQEVWFINLSQIYRQLLITSRYKPALLKVWGGTHLWGTEKWRVGGDKWEDFFFPSDDDVTTAFLFDLFELCIVLLILIRYKTGCS